MAQSLTLEGLRSQIVTSLVGRRLGLDPNQALLGTAGLRSPLTALSSASAAAVPTYGITTFNTAAATTTWTLAGSPTPGLPITLVALSSAQQDIVCSVTLRAAGASGLSTGTIARLRGIGAAIQLLPDSTSSWVSLTPQVSTVSTYGGIVV